MKKFAVAAFLAFASAQPGAVCAQEAVTVVPDSLKLELAQDILAIAYPEEVREPMFLAVAEQMHRQVLASFDRQFGDQSPTVSQILITWQATLFEERQTTLLNHVPRIMDAWAVSYANVFTEAELRDIRAFVQTESGQSFMLKSNSVVSDPAFAAANQAYLDETMQILEGSMPALIERLVALRDEAGQQE